VPLYIKEAEVTELVNELARRRGTTKRNAVKEAVKAALDEAPALTIQQKLEKFWAEYPLPEPTGEVADKAFFDELSGELLDIATA